MDVEVVRSGGIAGLRLSWTVNVEDQPDPEEWVLLIERLPWGETAPGLPDTGTPDVGSPRDALPGDGVGERYETARRAGKRLRDEEWLREEVAQTARARHNQAIFGCQLVDAEHRDDVAKLFVPTEDPTHVLCDRVVAVADNAWIHRLRRRCQWIDGRVQPLRSNVARQDKRGVDVPERLCDGGVRIVIGRHVDRLQ